MAWIKGFDFTRSSELVKVSPNSKVSATTSTACMHKKEGFFEFGIWGWCKKHRRQDRNGV